MTLRPCLDCGEPTDDARCPPHARLNERRDPERQRREAAYDWTWRRLSQRARRTSPTCEVCGTTEDLTTDHTPAAWERREAGLPIRLADVRVLCRTHNASAGAARGKGAR